MELQLETIVHSLEDAIVSVDENLTVLFLNESAAATFRCEGAVGRPVDQFPLLAGVLQQLKLADLDFSNNLPKAVRRLQGREPNGESYPLEACVTCATVGGRRIFSAVIRDVSLQQQMEKVVYDSRKTQAIAALAGGIAHDFNNILTAIISQIDLALYSKDLASSLKEHLIYAQASARRGAELVSKLQLFSRQTKPKFAPINLVEVADQVVFMLRRSVDPRIRLQYLPPSQIPWAVKADSNQIMQALMNLGLNARDAMPHGGELAVRLVNITVSSSEAAEHPRRRPGAYVRLTVADTGLGMSPEILSRLFEPYFSTKDKSRGPGLALSITSSVVAEHGGWMEVDSVVGKGTQFHIFLPRTEENMVPKRAADVEPDARTVEGHERILVVDDEELVRMVTRAVLAYRGYQVTEADDGDDAIEKYRDASPPFDLILIDLHMPRMNGHDALLKIRDINPRARAIILSGGLQERETTEDLQGVVFLQKPFENQELVRLVRATLDQ